MTDGLRELKVSELQPQAMVWLYKEDPSQLAIKTYTVWVVDIGDSHVEFASTEAGTHFLATRCGPDLERITDSSNSKLRIFEYPGRPRIALDAGGSYMEPDPEPRNTRWHMRIVRVERIPNTHAGHNVTLACGHGVQTFGRLDLANGVVFCTKCRDLEEGS